jgi:hypothetical protein
MNEAKRRNRAREKPVNCVTTGETYVSVRSASRETGVSTTSIVACASGRQSFAGRGKGGQRLVWRYAEMPPEPEDEAVEVVDIGAACRLWSVAHAPHQSTIPQRSSWRYFDA